VLLLLDFDGRTRMKRRLRDRVGDVRKLEGLAWCRYWEEEGTNRCEGNVFENA
jgi:hypothetical protein